MTPRFRGRREDARFIIGRGRYTADIDFPNQLHAHFVRSDRPHARLAMVELDRARAAPGVVAVLTAKDAIAAGFGTPRPLAVPPGHDGMRLIVPPRETLASDIVRFVGQEIALVVAESIDAARDAGELVSIDYQELPAVVTPGETAAGGQPIHQCAPGNLAFDYEYGDAAATEAAFARASHMTTLALHSTRIVGNPMEPKACVVTYDPNAAAYDVYACNQGAAMVLNDLAAITGSAREAIRVHPVDVGGGFGVRTDGYPEYGALMLAARLTGRPIKWVATRSETFLSDSHARAAHLQGTLALNADGDFLGLRIAWTVDMGAYLSQAGAFINTVTPSLHASSVYRCPALHGRHRLFFTNTVPTTAYRGAGRPNISYLVERLVDEAAREHGFDRIELRRRNMIVKEEFPYRTATSTYDSGDYPALLEAAVRHAEWPAFAARRAASLAQGKLRGIGCAAFVEPSGGGVSPVEQAAVAFTAAGIVATTLAGASGQGHETVFARIVADALGWPEDKIVVRPRPADAPALRGDSTYGSRSMIMNGGALLAAANEVIRKGLLLAAQHFEAAAEDIAFDAGLYRVAGTHLSLSLREIVRSHMPDTGPHPLDSIGDMASTRAFPSGVHIAEVEVDPETGALSVLRYTAVDDVGRMLDPVLVHGQMHGGIVQGLGQVVGEECVYEESGQLVTGTFMDYAMPRGDQLPVMSLHDHPVPSPNNPLGVKGAGEAGTTGAIPAVTNATIDALRPLGIHHLDMPFSPARLFAAIHASGRLNRSAK